MADTTLDASNVSVQKGSVVGIVYYGPLTATLPTTADAALTGFTSVGLIGEDGIVFSQSTDHKDIKDMNGDVVLSPQTSRSETCKFAMIEALNINAMKAAFGDANVSGDLAKGITIKHNSIETPKCAYVIDTVMSDGRAHRDVIPVANISAYDDITLKPDTAYAYGITLNCLKDKAGQTHYEYFGPTPTATAGA